VSDYIIAGVYNGLREKLLSEETRARMSPGARELWGVLMESGYEKAVATLVVVVDGTVSLYFSNGGGMIGMGGHEGPRRAGGALLEVAARYPDAAEPTTSYPLPGRGETQFLFLTREGVRATRGKDQDLAHASHPLHALFRQAHEVITEIRLVSQKVAKK